jgi:hypothetical protein
MLAAMFSREHPAGNWLYPLISGVALCVVAAGVVWIVSSRWRERAAALAADAEPAMGAAAPNLTAGEILDRRLAAGEITVSEYEHLLQVIGRRHAVAGAAAAGEHAKNGKNGKAAVV